MNRVRLVAVFVEDKLGELARTTRLLADANINIRWITVASSTGFGVMKVLVSDCEMAYQAFKHQGLVASLVEVLAVEVPDKAGSLHAVAEHLSHEGINLDNTSGFVANNRAVLIIEVQEIAKARSILGRQGLRLLTQEEMLNL